MSRDLNLDDNGDSYHDEIITVDETEGNKTRNKINQSVENAGVAFVKRVDERNKFFEKINNQ